MFSCFLCFHTHSVGMPIQPGGRGSFSWTSGSNRAEVGSWVAALIVPAPLRKGHLLGLQAVGAAFQPHARKHPIDRLVT